MIDGERVGLTPLTLTDLVARPRARVTLEHPDFVTERATVDLVAGREATIERKLALIRRIWEAVDADR